MRKLRQANQKLAQFQAQSDRTAAKLQKELTVALDAQKSLAADLNVIRNQSAQIQAAAAEKILSREAEFNKLVDTLIERDKASHRLQSELAVALDNKNQLATDLEKLNSFVMQTQTALETEQGRLHQVRLGHQDELEKLHQAYKSSASWRFSAPVRAIGRLIKPRRQGRGQNPPSPL